MAAANNGCRYSYFVASIRSVGIKFVMDRKLAILLSLCLGVVCAFAYYFGNASVTELQGGEDRAIKVKCRDLLKEWPRDNYHLLLTNFQRGKHIVSYDYNQDDCWELVYVPLFPDHLQKLGNNFSSVIVYFDDVRNEKDLRERLAPGTIDSQLWYTQQTLPHDIHSDLAQKYKLMDFSKCVILQGGFQPPNQKLAEYAILGSYIGMIASGIIVVWNVIAMLLPSRQTRRFLDDEDDGPVRNRAGIPDF